MSYVMIPSTLALQCYFADPVLVRDLDVLVRCGRIQDAARRDGADTPAGWFARAARAYSSPDDQAALARLACTLVSAAFASGVPS